MTKEEKLEEQFYPIVSHSKGDFLHCWGSNLPGESSDRKSDGIVREDTWASMVVSVTQEHIDEGVAGRCMLCPVALAISPHLADDAVVSVWVGSVHYLRRSSFNSHRLRPIGLHYLSEEPRQWIDIFDDRRGQRSEPAEFQVMVPASLLKK